MVDVQSDEIWKSYPHNPRYRVSNKGRVKSVWKSGKEHLLSQYTIRVYPAVGVLNRETGSKISLVHRLVLETFTGDAPKGYGCHHIDNNPVNNNLENLCWAPQKKNVHESWDMRHLVDENRKLKDLLLSNGIPIP